MDNSINIKIGDISTLISCQDGHFIDSAKEFYEDFLSESKPDYEVEIEYGKPVLNQKTDKLIFTDDGYVALPEFFAGYLEAKEGKIVVNSFSSIKYFLGVLYSYLCLRKNEIILHAAGIVRNGGSYVFIGPANSGKTAVADLCTDCTVLSDEAIIIKGDTVFGTPFGTGKYANTSTKISAFFRLVKDESIYLEELSYGKGLSELLSSLFIFNQRAVKPALLLCENLLNKFPCYKLHFGLNNSFWDAIEKNENVRKISS